jgi:putative DNA primase/helicase
LKGGSKLQFYDGNIPEVLKTQPNWVSWGIRGAPEKSPFNPESLLSGCPAPAKAGIRETWGSYKTAVECVKQGIAQGIGYEFDGSVYGIDLDNVIDESGALLPQAKEIVGKLDSYTEISPSGKGLHIFVTALDAEIICHRKKGFFLEIYNERRYFTVTGDLFGSKESIEARSRELQDIHDKYLLAPEKKLTTNNLSPPAPLENGEAGRFLSIGLNRDTVFQSLWAGSRPNGNESADDIALMNKLAYWCNKNSKAMLTAFLESPHYTQKSEAYQKKCSRTDYLPKTAENAISTAYSTAFADYTRWHEKNKERKNSR